MWTRFCPVHRAQFFFFFLVRKIIEQIGHEAAKKKKKIERNWTTTTIKKEFLHFTYIYITFLQNVCQDKPTFFVFLCFFVFCFWFFVFVVFCVFVLFVFCFVLVVFFKIFLSFCFISDTLVTVQYFKTDPEPHYAWGCLTLAFTLGPSIVMQIFSASWYVADEDMTKWRWIMHLLQLAPLQR